MKYSQNDEEQHILNYFHGARGHFLDIGANDGIGNSNSRRLVELGWTGVLVEPNPSAFAVLKKNCEGNVNLQLIEAFVGEDGTQDFWACADSQICTGSEVHKTFWEKHPGVEYKKISVPSLSYSSLIDLCLNKDFYFVTIDAEGWDVKIVQQIPLKSSTIQLMCVEAGGEDANKVLRYTAKYGFTLRYQSSENILIAR